jgi:hypothetical protein
MFYCNSGIDHTQHKRVGEVAALAVSLEPLARIQYTRISSLDSNYFLKWLVGGEKYEWRVTLGIPRDLNKFPFLLYRNVAGYIYLVIHTASQKCILRMCTTATAELCTYLVSIFPLLPIILFIVNVKVKLFLCFFLTEHYAMKAYWGVEVQLHAFWPPH